MTEARMEKRAMRRMSGAMSVCAVWNVQKIDGFIYLSQLRLEEGRRKKEGVELKIRSIRSLSSLNISII